MMVVVTFVSLCVHVYTIGYMHDDPGYQRFFSYISLFTFAMLMLVMSNNFLQLFFGWEAVGVVSYLLIGFWYKRPTAIFANLKAFLVNRVGDFGFLLGIAGDRLPPARWTTHGCLRRRDRIAGETIEILPGSSGRDDGRLHLPVHRRDGQVGAGAAARLAAGLDGRPDADLGADPRGDDGHGRHLHGRAHVAAVRVSPRRRCRFVLVIGATTAFFMGFLGIVRTTSSASSPIRRCRSSAT
jgi:NADH-quinone oxidoreductase subunit L